MVGLIRLWFCGFFDFGGIFSFCGTYWIEVDAPRLHHLLVAFLASPALLKIARFCPHRRGWRCIRFHPQVWHELKESSISVYLDVDSVNAKIHNTLPGIVTLRERAETALNLDHGSHYRFPESGETARNFDSINEATGAHLGRLH